MRNLRARKEVYCLCLKAPKGERRPADVISNAVKVMRIATHEETEDYGPEDTKDPAAKALGKKGGAARAGKMTPERRKEIAHQAAGKRWKSDGLLNFEVGRRFLDAPDFRRSRCSTSAAYPCMGWLCRGTNTASQSMTNSKTWPLPRSHLRPSVIVCSGPRRFFPQYKLFTFFYRVSYDLG